MYLFSSHLAFCVSNRCKEILEGTLYYQTLYYLSNIFAQFPPMSLGIFNQTLSKALRERKDYLISSVTHSKLDQSIKTASHGILDDCKMNLVELKKFKKRKQTILFFQLYMCVCLLRHNVTYIYYYRLRFQKVRKLLFELYILI